MWLPSFLTFPLPSLPSVSLPANIQRRFLSYVLKRSLGRFFVASGFDVERIQAQLSQGSVDLDRLEEINSLIPESLPFTVTAGEVAKVSARVPFPNLWSDPLSLTVDSLSLEVAITHQPKSSKPTTNSTFLGSSHLDLASSVTSAAGDFVHDELDAFEGAELDRSIRESLILTQSDPFSSSDIPGAFPPFGESGSPAAVESTTVLASLVERVLARLQCKVNNVRLRLRFEDETRGGVLELRIGGIRYADETPEMSAPRKTVRAISLSSVGVYVLPITAEFGHASSQQSTTDASSAAAYRSRSSSSSSSFSSDSRSSESSGDEFHSMVMSQAVADLRESVFVPPSSSIPRPAAASRDLRQSTMSNISGKSVYHSFVEDDEPEAEIEPAQATNRQQLADSLSSLDDPFAQPRAGAPEHASEASSSRSSRSATPTAQPSEPEETLLLSFGSEDIVFRMVTAQTIPTKRDWAQRDPGSPASMPLFIETPPLPVPTVEVSATCGTIAVLLRPQHTALLLAMAQSATTKSSSPSTPSRSPQAEPEAYTDEFTARLGIKAIYVSVIYDLTPLSPEAEDCVHQYFTRPSVISPPVGHLRLKVEDINASYALQGAQKRPQLRRKTAAKPSSSLDISISDISLFEYLVSAETDEADDDGPPGGTFPVLIFDVNLPKQYEVPPGAPSSLLSTQPRSPANLPNFPEFESIDWRQHGIHKKGGERVWRVRPKSKGILRGRAASTPEQTGPAVTISQKIGTNSPVNVSFLPVHFFLDLSLVERMLPLLRMVAPMNQPDSPTAVTPRASSRPPHRAPEVVGRRPQSSAAAVHVAIRCPMIRLDIRCPAPPSRRGSWGDGAHLRSGIVTLDIHGLNITLAEEKPLSPFPRRLSQPQVDTSGQGGVSLDWQKMVFLFSRAPEKRTSAFLVIGPLAPEPGDEGVLLPTVVVRSEVTMSAEKAQSVTCSIPSVQAKIRQPTVEGLQFFADDMTHWLDGAFGDGSAPKPLDDLKMIGSRFFGSKASSSASSSDDYDDEDDSRATLFRVTISEAEVALLVPKTDKSERILSLRASDLDLKVDSNTTEKQETTISITAMDADLFHYAEIGGTASRLFGRTTPLTLTTHTQPLFNLRFSSLTNPDRTKETGIRLTTTACAVFVTRELDWVRDLKLYAKTPEGVFEDVVPSEVTRIQIFLHDCSLHIAAPNLPGALVVVSNVVEVRTVMESEGDDSTIDIGVSGVHVLAIDELASASPLPMGYTMSLDAWKRGGYAQLVELVTMDAQIVRSTVPDSTLLDIIHSNVRVTACADSFATLAALAGDMSKLVPSPPEVPQRRMTLDQSVDVFASIDLEAFNQAPEIASSVDMIDDDLPTNLDYLDHAAGAKLGVDKSTGESLRSWETPDEGQGHGMDLNRGTVKILSKEVFEEDDYWNNLPELKQEAETRLGKSRVRVQSCDVSVMLYEGYDWPRTRKAIEEEIKAMRRRLEKIKQLLASGQKADASIDTTSSVLFNSVYIGFEQRDDMDSTQLMAAIDEELEDLNRAETETQSSWQTVPQAGGLPTANNSNNNRGRKSNVRLRGKRLTRSKRPQIEFKLDGLKADIDVYGPEDETVMFVHLTARGFEILDHIKTSTWKKFLTEMKADARGNVRETDADMLRIEVVTVRPNLPSTDEEIRLRVKILPLRLHVDQDALDFLKHYFSFSSPGELPPAAGRKTEPFFQHVEIFPVELKLDYKPKRVDYAALRQGRTIELMNFFHFEGAEMTLRHVTLSGVTGSTRLSDMLQDIWTPDVKANQLADVISGVSPIRSVVNVGSGVADLILLPIEQYRKDGRVARGVQRGTNSFVRSTAMEMMKLGARLATGTQVVLEHAEGILGKESVVLEQVRGESDDEGQDAVSRYANQPTDVREGVKAAYDSLSSNINSAAQTILAVPMEVYERSGEDGPLKAVVRAVPIAVLKPMIGASEAVSKTLWGLRNTLDPEGRREMGDKYK